MRGNMLRLLRICRRSHQITVIARAAFRFCKCCCTGAVKYSGSPLNLSGDMKTAALKAIENGEVLSFTLAEKNTEYLSLSDYSDYCNVNYAALKETVIQYYNLYSETLARVSDEIITDHMLLSDKVTATVYESGRR